MPAEETQKLLQPRNHKAKILIWADLTVSDMDVLSELSTAEAIKGELSRMMNLEDSTNMKNIILLDLYYYTLQFAFKNEFKKEQASAFFSLVKSTHEVAVETPFGNIENCFQYFRELVLCHAVKRPPFSIDLFSPDQVKLITDYVINTYFRHYKMYKYVFTPEVRLDLSMTYPGMPPTPVPSEAGDDVDRDGETGEDKAEEEEETQTEQKVDSPAASELKQLIRQHLTTELAALKLEVDQQIQATDQMLSEKLKAAEQSSGGKTGGASGKGKRK